MVIVRCACRPEGDTRARCRIKEIRLDAVAGHFWVELDNGDERLMYLKRDQLRKLKLELEIVR